MKRFLVLLLAFAVPAAAAADEDALADRPTVEIVRADAPPVLDGRLDDAIWRTAAKVETFTQRAPRDGAPASEQTEVWMAYDSRQLYFAIYAHYSDPSLIRANRVDRDKTSRDDRVAVYFDTFLDQQRAYRFSVNGYGVQGDAVRNGGRGRGDGPVDRDEDDSWDALFDSAGGLVEDGWIVEMAIPFKSLRYPARQRGEAHRWGFQILRIIESKDEDVVWSPVSRDIDGFLTQMGVLHGMTDLSTSKNIEVLPTLTAVQAGSLDQDTGVYHDAKVDPDFGINFKYGVTSNLTADVTFNPDFSQIESDRPQIDVNQRFPLFYPETRPFFLEGQEVFDTQINLVHTRTIVNPQWGGKLTGKVGKTSLGVLVANDEAPGKRDDPADPALGQTAQVLVARVRRDLYAESHLGVIVADREFMDSYSRTAGVDGRLRLGQIHRLSFMAVASDSRSEEGERSSGPAFQAGFSRSGRGLDYFIGHVNISPGFKADTGFIRRTDIQRTNGRVSYTFWPQSWVISYGPSAEYQRNYDHQNVLQDEQAEVGFNVRFARNVGLQGNASREMERFEGVDFRKRRFGLRGWANFSRKVSFGGNWNWGEGVHYEDTPLLGRGREGSFNVTARPTSRLEGHLSVDLSRLANPATGEELFDVKIYRTRATYQFSDRLQLRNILEYDTFTGKFSGNLLATYRINAGTVVFVGYDDHLERAVNVNPELFDTRRLERTNRSVFMKIAYLFRY